MATEFASYLQLPDDKCTSDLKTMSWRRDSHSPTPTASDSGSILSSSNSSIGSEDIPNSPAQTRYVSTSVITAFILAQGHNNHKKLNRSQSEPRARYNRNMGGIASSRYKTELCHPFEENGVCKYGEKCQFAHGVHELRDMARHPKYKTELCRTFHAEGYCPYGTRCHFIHEERNLSKSKPTALCLLPNVMSASSLKDLSLSPNSLCSLSPASSTNTFSFAAAPVCSPPPSPIETRLPIFNEISAPTLLPFHRQFGGLTA